jgi:ribosomal protein L31E
MSATKSYSVEKRITRSVAKIIQKNKSDQTSSMFIEIDNKLNSNVNDNGRKKMKKKEKVVPAANVFNSGMCITQDSVDFFHKLALYVSLVFHL